MLQFVETSVAAVVDAHQRRVVALFVDPAGYLREDSNGNDKLDNYNTDKVIEIYFDEDLRRSRIKRFGSDSDDEFIQSSESDDELTSLKPIWNAREQLSAVSNVTTQRTYSATADTGRSPAGGRASVESQTGGGPWATSCRAPTRCAPSTPGSSGR